MSEEVVQLDSLTAPKNMSNKDLILYLAEKFPQCFFASGETKPLKIGIFKDLVIALQDDEKVSKTALRQALRAYTMSWRYLHCCKENSVRIDLAGNGAGIVDAQQAEHAAKSLAESKESYTQYREQQRKAQRKEFFKQKNKRKNEKGTVKQSKSSHKNIQPLQAIALSQLKIGQSVKIQMGTHFQIATVVEIEKSNVRVQTNSGIIMNATAEMLFS